MVTADRAIDGEWLITAGLAAGDRVVLDGLQKVKPGVGGQGRSGAEEQADERRHAGGRDTPKS